MIPVRKWDVKASVSDQSLKVITISIVLRNVEKESIFSQAESFHSHALT